MEKKKLKGLEMEAWEMIAMMVIICDAMEKKTTVKELLNSRGIKYGYRDWRCANALLDKLNDAVLDTVPDKQLRTIRQNVMQNTIKFTPKHSANPLPPDMWCMTREDLLVLADKATETTCAMCDRQDVWNCKLREVMKDLPLELTEEGAIFCRCMNNVEI